MLYQALQEHSSSNQELSKTYLGNHQCLALEELSRQSLGGPTNAGEDKKCKILDATVGVVHIFLIEAVIWLQTQIWFVGKRNPIWSSIRQIRFRMVVCLPTANHAGTSPNV